jgi:HSP20 family protein
VVDPFESMSRDLDTIVNRLAGREWAGAVLAPYAVDIREDADHLYIEAELPGFTREQVDVTLDNNTLTISASREAPGETPTPGAHEGEWLLRERRFTRFQRSFTLPNTIDESSVNAKLEHGVLSVTLDKRQEARPRKISIT